MLLDQEITPEYIRSLDYPQLEALAAEIREMLVSAVTTHGGHLGSNLGVVELTLALHRVFRSPRDIILWDTGHQAYVHKIVTGRAKLFEQLRQPGGLSGYPSREESEHDWIENSHASTALSYAHGFATSLRVDPANRTAEGEADERSEGRRRVGAVVGDGALTGGMAYEGLNNIGHSHSDVLIILNDNGRSYAQTASRLSERLARLRIKPSNVRRQERVERILAELPLVGDHVDRVVDAAKAAIREFWDEPTLFEDLGIRYTGPYDGHDLRSLEKSLSRAAELAGPVLFHVSTEKGRGYLPAEQDPVKRMHDTSVTKPGSYTEAFSEAIVKAAEEHPNLVAITAAMPDSTGLLSFKDRFADRFIDVGIAEQHAVGAAAGMAMGGLRPVVAVYSTFLSRAFDQVNLDVGMHRQPVVFCLDRAGITGDDGASHHGIWDMALLSRVPGMTIMAPSSYQELGAMLNQALLITDGPAAIRWPKTPARHVAESEIGKGLDGRKVRSGTEVCLLAVGKMLDAAEEAAEILHGGGVSASVWDVRVVKPLDAKMLADAMEHRLVVTIEDGVCEGGAGTGIAAALERMAAESPGTDSVAESDRGDLQPSPPAVRVLGVPLTYLPHGNVERILAGCGLDAKGIASSALNALRNSKTPGD